MITIALKDNSIVPTNELVFSCLGEKKHLWEKLHQKLSLEQSEIKGEWRYYNDGKSWLYRGLKKDKVIFWVGVALNDFNVTFYLSQKAEDLIANSDLPENMKLDFEGTKGMKFRYIAVLVQNEDDIDNILKLVKIKLKV